MASDARRWLWIVPAVVALAWLVAYVVAVVRHDGDLAVPRLPTWCFYAVPWSLALAIAVGGAGRGLLRGLGLGLMTVPVWDTLMGIADSFGPLLQGGFVLRAYTEYQLSRIYSYKLLSDLGYLGVGFLLFAGGTRFLRETPQSLARRLAELGLPMGRRSEGSSALIGLAAFPLLLIVTLAVNYGLSGLESLQQSDESSVFANMTIYHALLISLAAAFGEELLYRGLLQTALARKLPMAVAIVLQAVVFGLAHSGYGTWIHVLLPMMFGLVSGIVAWRFGIWSTIVLHVAVDVFAFTAEVASNGDEWLWSILNGAFIANVALSIGVGITWLVRRVNGSPAPS